MKVSEKGTCGRGYDLRQLKGDTESTEVDEWKLKNSGQSRDYVSRRRGDFRAIQSFTSDSTNRKGQGQWTFQRSVRGYFLGQSLGGSAATH